MGLGSGWGVGDVLLSRNGVCKRLGVGDVLLSRSGQWGFLGRDVGCD